MNLEDLKRQADATWREFESGHAARVLVGTGTCGKAAGAGKVLTAVHSWFEFSGIDAGVYEVGCLGLCYAEPLVELSRPGARRILYGNVTTDNIGPILQRFFTGDELVVDQAIAIMDGPAVDGIPAFGDHPMLAGQVRVALRNCGLIDPVSIDHYTANAGYSGLAKALAKSPEQVIEEVRSAGLRGRGGAGFPTGTKWNLCRNSPGEEKYVICNADEGDPGAFMDRSLLESDPHAVIEGMAICAYAVGASNGYVYVRAEYPLAIERLESAIRAARDAGVLGNDILGSDFSFDIRIKKGAGAFVCGEETALLASLEGRRGLPRPRPPFPAQAGLYGKPTNINNVETLANVPAILEKGSAWFASNGTEKSAGTKTFALAGKVVRTGLVEVPLGISLREIVFDIGGGIPDDKQFRAVQTGGPSGGCIPAELLDVSVDYEKLAEAGAIMGSGGMVVMDEETCMVDIARYFTEFTQEESCGKCVPCRLGTKQMLEILNDLTSGTARAGDIELLIEVAESVSQGSLCGLGQTAPNPALTTLRYFREEYDAHLNEKRCPARGCKALISFHIDPEKCVGCMACAKVCPTSAITGEKKEVHELDPEKSVRCGACFDACKFDAVVVTSPRKNA